MAYIQTTYYSQALMKQATFNMFLPHDVPPHMIEGNENYDRPMKTLYLLHGYSGFAGDWVQGSLAQEMAIKYNLAIVMPTGDNSFYVNARGAGHAYATYVGEELVSYVSKTFGLSNKKEDTFIGGLSMGGFGAIHTALAYPEQFAATFGLSSALIVNNIKNMEPGTLDGIADYDYYEMIFGDLTKLDESDKNPEYLIRKLKEEGKDIPGIYMACGSEDPLLETNKEFVEFLTKENVDFTYEESTGTHDWVFWNEYFEPAIKWLLAAE